MWSRSSLAYLYLTHYVLTQVGVCDQIKDAAQLFFFLLFLLRQHKFLSFLYNSMCGLPSFNLYSLIKVMMKLFSVWLLSLENTRFFSLVRAALLKTLW